MLPLSKEDPKSFEFFFDLLEHPWVKSQAKVKEISLETVRDTEAIAQFVKMLSQSLEKQDIKVSLSEIVSFLSFHLNKLNEEIPFIFPEDYYRVLCISDSFDSSRTPLPFQIYERLYLGESNVHFPVYLDVRVFKLDNIQQADAIIQWHFGLLSENSRLETPSHYHIIKGFPSEEKNLHSHGFAALQGERGVFLYPCLKDNKLFLLFAEAPWAPFEAFCMPIISKIEIKPFSSKN
jgi:hypothetical protein